ncbi:MAG: RNA polymerase sigma factor SigZ [Vallitaleaceae bacterium]|nr:RNA polymerase sigma factor SigZ [Vallitaleaceae bacterium]
MRDIQTNNIWNKFNYELLNYIKSKVSDQYEAEDILQDVFIKIYKNIDQLDDEAKLKSWLYKITNNTIIDWYRKRKATDINIDLFDIPIRVEEDLLTMNDEIGACLIKFLGRLPKKYRDPLEMYEFKGMKHKDISNVLSISLSGSKTRVQRARVKLREVLVACCELELDTYGNVMAYKKKEDYQCTKDNTKG